MNPYDVGSECRSDEYRHQKVTNQFYTIEKSCILSSEWVSEHSPIVVWIRADLYDEDCHNHTHQRDPRQPRVVNVSTRSCRKNGSGK